jgi:hypothetical protein
MAALSAACLQVANGAGLRLALNGYFADFAGAAETLKSGCCGRPRKNGENQMSYYDPLETRDPDEREDDLMDKLPRQVAHAKETTHHYFHHAWPGSIRSRWSPVRHWRDCR